MTVAPSPRFVARVKAGCNVSRYLMERYGLALTPVLWRCLLVCLTDQRSGE